MARGKKKETLTPEERLQAALVPESEQPYKVPGNWTWVKVGDLCTFIGGGTPDKTNPLYWNGNISWASVKDIKGSYLYSTIDKISQLGLESSSSNLCEAGDLLLVTRIEPAKTIVSKIVTAINQDLKIVKSELSSLFLYHYFCAFQHEFEKKASGSTVKGITLPNIQNTPFPLPPLPEQQRIVNRIESLFAKLDEAKQKAQDALDSFEPRKAAILHSAFTGELTARWRKERGIGMDSWERLKLGEIGTLERGRSQHRPRNDPRLFGGPYPFIQTGDVASANVYITEHHQTLSEFGMEQSRMFSAETLCITIAANIGDVAILSYDCCFPDSVVGFIPNNRSISKFVYYMMSVLQKELEDNAPATAQKNINLKILNAVEMNIPPVIEQAEIVRRLDNLLAKEQQAKENAEKVLEQIDLIKKAILARAFRGELGTNDPSEESAVELLKQVL